MRQVPRSRRRASVPSPAGEIRDSAMQSVEEVARDTAGAIVRALVPSAADDGALGEAITRRLKG